MKAKIHTLWPFPWKQSTWQNPNPERTNQNAQIYLKSTSSNLMVFHYFVFILVNVNEFLDVLEQKLAK